MGTPGTGRILGPEILVFSRNFAQTHHICTHHLRKKLIWLDDPD